MAGKAQSVVDVLLGEAAYGTPQQRYADMKAIASVISNRARELGVTPEEVVSADNQFSAYGQALPAGVEAYRSLAEMALQDVAINGPVHTGSFYATPAAVDNLPSGLKQVASTSGHQYFEDPQGRAISTAAGYRTPAPQASEMGFSSFEPSGDLGLSNYAEDAPSRGLGMGALAPNGLLGIGDTTFGSFDRSQLNASLGPVMDAIGGQIAMSALPDIGINSGFRSATKNAKAGGAKGSQHLQGKALDLSIAGLTDEQKYDLLNTAIEAGAKGIGLYPSGNVMHIDTRQSPAMWGMVPGAQYKGMSLEQAPDWARETLGMMMDAGQFDVTPRGAPTPTSRDFGLSQPVDMAGQAAARSQMGQTMAQAGVSNLAGKQTASPTRPDNFSAPGQLVGAKAGGLGGLGGVATAPAQDPYSAFEAQRAAAFSSMPDPSFSPASISPNPVSSVASLSAPATASIDPTAISAVASMPQSLTPSFTPTVAPMVTPTPVRVAPVTPRSVVAPQPTNSPQPAQVSTPSYSVADVYAGKAPAGYQAQATGGNLVSRDPETGNTSITNSFGVTSTFDPSGRQLGSLKGAPPGLVGAALGAALGGIPGAVAGYSVGNRLGGKKSGGLGGLGGFLSDLFGGSSDGGGSSSGSTSSGGRSSGSGRAGADRDHSGNR